MDPEALIADLDPDQRAAVTAESLLVAVVAGAGSGKTRVLTRRIAHRVATGRADARHTLALTFTRESAGELRRRLHRLGLREHVEAGTFHSVMLGLLKQRWEDTGRRPLTVVEDRRRLVGDALTGDRRGLDSLLAEIGWATARGIGAGRLRRTGTARQPPTATPGSSGPVGVRRLRPAETAARCDRLRRRAEPYDRDLRSDSDFAAATRWRFRHLLVDEAQDLNPLQHQLVDLLRSGRDDLFLVGDPAQAIYGFNGADPRCSSTSRNDFPASRSSAFRSTTAAHHRSCGPACTCSSGPQPAGLVSNRPDGRQVS